MRDLVIKPRKTIRQRVYEHLREAILTSEIAPRQRLVEADLAARIGVSRTPVREALHTLEREGLINGRPGVGYVVRPVSRTELWELSEIRLVLEGLALDWALAKQPDKLAKALGGNVRRCEEALARGEVKFFVDLDGDFHEIIASLAESERLSEMSGSIRRYMFRYRIDSIYTEENVRLSVAGHRAIHEAVAKGDPEAAQEALKAHIHRSRQAILEYAFQKQETDPGR